MNRRLVLSILFLLFSICANLLGAAKTVHVFVALCDNKSQGIVPVPKELGNGDDPKNNLYWGAMYGVKGFLKKSAEWTLVKSFSKPGKHVLERCVYKHKTKDVYLVADAYRGSSIKDAKVAFLNATDGQNNELLVLGKITLPIKGMASLKVYVGHNGLMDFVLPRELTVSGKGGAHDAVVLCCKSRDYFEALLKTRKANPLVLTTGLMAPEAYILEAILAGWVAGERRGQIRKRAAKAYSKYQKCSLKAAEKLFDAR